MLNALLLFLGGQASAPKPFDDYASMLKQLGVSRVRRGPDPNHQSTFDEAQANPYRDSMPDVLRTKNGTRVTWAEGWRSRRAEIAEDFSREVYGRVPKRVPTVRWEITGVIPGESGGVQTVTRTLLGHVESSSKPSLAIAIQASYTVPVHAAGRVPAMIEIGGFGPRRSGTSIPWTQQAIAHGWGYGTINPGSIQPDNARLNTGIIGLCNEGRPRKPDDWGALRAWAWGVSKLIDYFETNPQSGVDAKAVGVEGVSRYGKAAIVAEAFDERVAVGLIGSSGEGGTKLHRHLFGEAVENLAGGEFYWMAGNFIKYGADEPHRTAADLPVDSHELIALCAPRPVFISHGVVERGDAKWIDVHGSFMAGVLATPVYRLLGKTGFGSGDYLTQPMPPVGQLVGGELAWRQHEGGHEVTPNWPPFFDWVRTYVPSRPPVPGGVPYRVSADEPTPRQDANSRQAHSDLLKKAQTGRINLYFLGDSITRRWGTRDPQYSPMLANWTANFYGWNAGNFGWGGDSTGNILWRIRNGELDGVDPKVIVLLGGTNNIGADSPEEIARGISAILTACRQKAPRATIVLTAITPRSDKPGVMQSVDEVNRRLARLANGRAVRFLNVNSRMLDAGGHLIPTMTTDGLHLSVNGYKVWADGLHPILRELLGPPSSRDLAPPPTGDPGIKGQE